MVICLTYESYLHGILCNSTFGLSKILTHSLCPRHIGYNLIKMDQLWVLNNINSSILVELAGQRGRSKWWKPQLDSGVVTKLKIVRCAVL